MYKEPFLLPMENLPVGLGDTRKLSVSNGLEERTEGRGVVSAWENAAAQRRPRGTSEEMEVREGPGLAWGHSHSLGIPGTHSQPPWEHLTTLRALSPMAGGSDWPPDM